MNIRRIETFEKILLYLVILFLPTQLGKHFWPQFAYIYSLPIDYFAPTIYFWDLLVVVLLGVWLIRRPKVNSVALFGLLIWLLTQLLSIIYAVNVGAGLVRWAEYLITGLFGVYLASLEWSKLSVVLRRCLPVVIVVESVMAIGQFSLGHSLGLWILGERAIDIGNPLIAKFNWFGQVWLRPYGTFSHPNVLAGVMLVMLLLLDVVKFKSTWVRVLGSVGIGLSFSRGALGLLAVYWLTKLKFKSYWFWAAIVVTLPFLAVRFLSAFNFDYLSILRREELAEIAGQFWWSNPWVGVGLNNFIVQTASSSLISGASRFLQPAHNIVLLTLAETGVIGLVGLMVMIGTPIYRLWRQRTVMANILLLIWGAIFILGMFDHYWLTLPQGIRAMLLVWGVSWSVIQWGRESTA